MQRKGSTNVLPEGTKSVTADLTNKADLVAAFRGQDAVVRYVDLFNDPQNNDLNELQRRAYAKFQ